MSWLTRPINPTSDSCLLMVIWLTVVQRCQLYRQLQLKTLNQNLPDCLVSANGHHIRTFGQRRANVTLLGHQCSHDMIVADVVHPILGMDFFRNGEGTRFVIDPTRGCLVDRTTDKENNAIVSVSSVAYIDDDYYQCLWLQFPDVVDPNLCSVATMTTPLHIANEGSPVFSPCRKLHGDKKKEVEEQLRQWEADQVIERCESDWASPIHAVKKADGSWRVCGDFRRLNAMTKLDRYPLPMLTSFNEQLAGCDTFSKIDLRQVFQQVRVDEASQPKTAIITTIGLFKFLRMPYGLKNAAQCFQRNLHQLLRDLPFSCFIYMDDIIVGSKGKENHMRDLLILFQRLREKGLLINKRKCQLGRTSLTFLGHFVDANGISIPASRVEIVKRYPTPKTPKDLERFLGICAFFHRFVRHASGKMASLAKLKNISQEFESAWLPAHDKAFASMKDAIANATLLVHPLPSAPTEIWCDASNSAIGAVLMQFQRGMWKPLSFWSKQLNKAQCGYSATDRELIAVSYSVDKFRSYLEGQPIVVRTDHLPLVGSLTKKADTALPMPRRHLLKIAQFIDRLYYLKGDSNVVADALSRITLPTGEDFAMPDTCTASELNDPLPEEGSPQAMTDDALVDDTFLPLLHKRRDLVERQLKAPTFIPATTLTTGNIHDGVTFASPLQVTATRHQSAHAALSSRHNRHPLSSYKQFNECAMNRSAMCHFKSGSSITQRRRPSSLPN